MILTGEIIHGETPGDGLLIQRLRLPRYGMQFTGLNLALSAYHMLYVCQEQQVPQLCGIKNIWRMNDHLVAALLILEGHGSHGVAIALRCNGAMMQEDVYLEFRAIRCQHGF